MIRATNDDMGDDVGEPGTIGENVLRNEREIAELARVLGLKRNFALNYNNHRMGDDLAERADLPPDLSVPPAQGGYGLLLRPLGARRGESRSLRARPLRGSRVLDGRPRCTIIPSSSPPGCRPHAVSEKYYYARHPEITRVVDISGVVDKKIDANRCNVAKGPGGHHGSQAARRTGQASNQQLPLLGDDDPTADRNYIKEFVLAHDRETGRKYGVEYAEAFHYIGTGHSRVEDYIKQHAVPLK